MAFSLIPLSALAVEDTGGELLYEESEEGPESEDTLDTLQQEAENEEEDLGDPADKSAESIEDENGAASFAAPQEEENANSEEAQDAEEPIDEIDLLADSQDDTEEPDDSDETEWTEIDLLPELEYDDRYSLGDLSELKETGEDYVISDITNEPESCQVVSGQVTKNPDEVITQASKDSLDIIATGVGTATIYLVPADQEETDEKPGEKTDDADSSENEETSKAGFQVNVTVVPATLTLMYLTGQSNMEGLCSDSTGYDLNASVACQEGTVYSTYAPTSSSNAKNITGLSFSETCNENNASDFVAGSLQSDTSISGENLTYQLNSLTTEGSGKTGPDSGLAYEWNDLTGDKVWVINTAWSSTGVGSWIPGATQYKRSAAVWNYVEQVYQAEIEAGHYTDGGRLAFWLQGESDTTAKTTTEDYISEFTSMQASMQEALSLNAFGIIMVRGSGTGDSTSGAYTTDKDLKMSNPRIAQYVLGGSSGPSDVYIVSNANEQWVTDAGVKSYFQTAYSGGSLSYPMHSGSTSLPTTVKAVHSDIHYSQIGHNENGITAADGMYQALYGSTTPVSVSWKDEDGSSITSMTLLVTGDTAVAVPVADPVYSAREVTCSSGSGISYDSQNCIVTAKSTGSHTLSASYEGKSSDLTVKVSVSKDLSSVAGSNYTGLYKYDGNWWYLKNGVIQRDYESVVKNENGWWYVNNGMVDFTYTGFAENSNGWWYIENGEVTFNTNSVIKDTNKKIDGAETWWYVVGSQVQTGFTGLADYKNSSGWWYINNGKVTFDVETVAKNKNGWYYVKDSKVDFSYNGFAENSNGWWYIEDGTVTFNKNSVIKDTNKKIDGAATWWYVVGSEVQTSFTGLADYKNSNGWWYISKGKVTFDVNTVAKNKNGWYYVKDSKVDFNYNGFEKNSNGWWYLENGTVTFNKNSVIKDNNKKIDGAKSWWYVVGSKVQTGYTGVANYKNSNGWWYIKNGKVDFTANTVAKNKNGWWYVLGGKVQFGFTGLANYKNSNGWWYINSGKVTFNVNTVAKNKNGWWYVKNSKVDFGFNGIASNSNGRWYLQGGKVDFTYNGTCNYNGKRYTIVNGKVR